MIKAINTIETLFDPLRDVALNEKLKPRIEEIRSLIRDTYIPNIRFVLCNNGMSWNEIAQQSIDAADKNYGDKVSFDHVNHDRIVKILQRSKTVDENIALSGKASVEDMNYLRVLIGRVSVHEIHRIFEQHGDTLLERNVRRYLGMHSNRVNRAIHATLNNSEIVDKFYFYNNGITVVCDKFDYNALQRKILKFR